MPSYPVSLSLFFSGLTSQVLKLLGNDQRTLSLGFRG